MTILERTKNSAKGNIFTLYKEGLFYKCYNEDVMVFSQCVKAYKISVKFVKNVGAKVMSLGFPVSEVKKGNLSLEFISEKIRAKNIEVNVDSVVFILDNAEVKSNYIVWSDAIKQEILVNMVNEPEGVYKSIDAMDRISNMIKDFDLANSTPMQGLNFIQLLKSELNKLEKNDGNI